MKSCLSALAFLFLTRSAFALTCQPLPGREGAVVENCGGIRVVRLAGTPLERARTLGGLVREGKISRELLRYFTDKVSEIASVETGWLAGPVNLAYNQLVRLFHHAAPSALEAEVDAMSLAMGIDPIVLRRGLSLPDTGVFVQGLGSYPGLAFLPATACTSVGARLEGGGFAYGRNLDFAGVGVWDRHPMILSAEPPPGSGELKHLVIGAEGLPFAGITGVNEAGITFAVHQNYSRDISVSGVPMVMIGEIVLRQARTLDQAIEILRANRPASLWTFVLTDLAGRALAVESSSRFFLVRDANAPYFVQTNHALHPETRDYENGTYGFRANSQYRLDHILQAFFAYPPKSTAEIARALAYQENPFGQLSAYHDVLKTETIQTVLFESHGPGTTTLALSVDPAPTASGRYAVFRLRDFWERSPPSWEPRDFLNTPEETRLRQRAAAAAYMKYFDERRLNEAAALLASHHTIDAALFRCVAMEEQGRYEDSVRIADEALGDPRFRADPEYIRDSLTHVKLAALIRLKREEEARALAQSVVERGEPGSSGATKQVALFDLARRVVSRSWIPGWRLAPHFDFFSGDLSGRKD